MSQFPIHWTLDCLPHPLTAEFKSRLAELTADLNVLASDSDGLPVITAAGAAGKWGAFIERFSLVFARFEEMSSFIGCHAAADADNKEFRRIEGTLSALGPQRTHVLTNLELAFVGVDATKTDEFLNGDARLVAVRFFLEECRRNASLRLPKEQELLVAELSVDGLHAWSRLYDRLSGDLRIEVMEKGELVKKSPGQVMFDMPERSVRENNAYAANKAWSTIGDSCADALNHIAGARLTKYKRLGLKDHLEAPLRINRMRRETLDTMWRVISERKDCLLPFLAEKARRLGLPKLAWYDLFAPLPVEPAPKGQPTKEGTGQETHTSAKISYDQASRMVIDALGAFSPDMGEFANMALTQNWCEVENRAGKRQGAFCTGLPVSRVSRVFMTFTDTADSMSTLAHELGHAYHSWVLRDEPFLLQDYPMNLAETASTFAEAVLAEQRLERANAAERDSILDNMLSDAVAFMMNIHARFIFEDRFHQERANGELTAARLSELMLSAQQEAFCNSLADDGWNPSFWISKLHFYISGIPFYNFPYTFGYLLSTGLYALAKQGQTDFPARYRQLLIATGNREAEAAVLDTFGADLTRPEFWHQSIDVIEERVKLFV